MRAAASYPATTAARKSCRAVSGHSFRKRQCDGDTSWCRGESSRRCGYRPARCRERPCRWRARQARACVRMRGADHGGRSRSRPCARIMRCTHRADSSCEPRIGDRQDSRAGNSARGPRPRGKLARSESVQEFDQLARVFGLCVVHGLPEDAATIRVSKMYYSLSLYFFSRLRAMIRRCSSLVPPPMTTSGASR